MAEYRERFEEVYEAYSGLILVYAARRTASPSDAADIVAETFMVAWRRIADVPAGEQARPWLYAVAARVLANHHRGNQRRRRLNSVLASEVPALVQRATGDLEGPDLEAIATAFSALSDGDRELLTLVGWDGLSREVVATMLGCSATTVRVRLHRARRRFERHLSAAGVTRTSASGHGPGRWATAHLDPEEA